MWPRSFTNSSPSLVPLHTCLHHHHPFVCAFCVSIMKYWLLDVLARSGEFVFVFQSYFFLNKISVIFINTHSFINCVSNVLIVLCCHSTCWPKREVTIGENGLYYRILHVSVCCFLLNIIPPNKQWFSNDETFSLQGTDGPPGPSGPAGPKGDIVRLICVPLWHYFLKPLEMPILV